MSIQVFAWIDDEDAGDSGMAQRSLLTQRRGHSGGIGDGHGKGQERAQARCSRNGWPWSLRVTVEDASLARCTHDRCEPGRQSGQTLCTSPLPPSLVSVPPATGADPGQPAARTEAKQISAEQDRREGELGIGG